MLVTSVAALVASCSTDSTQSRHPASIARPAFTEAEYGVSSSPRVAGLSSRIPKGGGHFKLGSPYKVAGRWYVPSEDRHYDRQGIASWYGADFHGRKTSNGEVFDMRAMTAAHPTFPLPSYAYVTNLDNGRTVLVRVNDRGPYVAGRIMDLSHAAASALDYVGRGKARVRVQYAGRAPLNGDDRREQAFLRDRTWTRGGAVRMAAASAAQRYEAPKPTPIWSPLSYRSAEAGGRSRPSYLGGPLPDEAAIGGRAYVVAGYYEDRQSAERLRDTLRPFGKSALNTLRTASGTTLYRVRVGPVARKTAEIMLPGIVGVGAPDAEVVSE